MSIFTKFRDRKLIHDEYSAIEGAKLTPEELKLIELELERDILEAEANADAIYYGAIVYDPPMSQTDEYLLNKERMEAYYD